MSLENYQYGIFQCNDLIKDFKESTGNLSGSSPRTVLLGQICKIDKVTLTQNINKLNKRQYKITFLRDNKLWESEIFVIDASNTIIKNIIKLPSDLWMYVAAIATPGERIKFAKNAMLLDKFETIKIDSTVGFTQANDIKLGKVKYMGAVEDIGHCFGVQLNEKLPNNKCDGLYKHTRYFYCPKGSGIFTTIERIIPEYGSRNYPQNKASSSQLFSDLDLSLEKNLNSFATSGTLAPHEKIVTKYGQYTSQSKEIKPPTTKYSNYNRNSSLSLENILTEGLAKNYSNSNSISINTTNDFDQNSIIQPDRSYLMKSEKIKNISDTTNLHSSIGNSSLMRTIDSMTKTNNTSNLKKTIEKNRKYDMLNTNSSSIESSDGKLAKNEKMNHFISDTNLNKEMKSKFYDSENLSPKVKRTKGIELNNKSDKADKKHASTLKREIAAASTPPPPPPPPSAQLTKSSAIFYVNKDESLSLSPHKYKTKPLPDSTNDLVVGSLVEVDTDVTKGPLYGVIRWMGHDPDVSFTLVGIELEDDIVNDLPLTLTDGTYNNERYFQCDNERAFFVPLDWCRKDSRFQDGLPVLSHNFSGSRDQQLLESSVDDINCVAIPGAVPPLCMPTEDDIEAVCGKNRGIQGHHNSCYLDVTLFAMFTYTSVFDSLLFRPKNSLDISDYDEVQKVLREEIVNPLRKNLYVNANNVMKLRKLLDRLSSVSGLTSEEKDPEEFLNSLLAQILKAEPFLKLSSGQEAFHYQLFVEKDAKLSLPTVQQLFEQSFLTSAIKLKEVPSCLIIQMPRFGKNYKMYPRILPSQLLDVTDVIEGSPRQCTVCGELARWECRQCFSNESIQNQVGLESTAFCSQCCQTAHKSEKRQKHTPKRLVINEEYLAVENYYKPSRLYMELFAVISIETSHYVAFVKCGVGHAAPWCFFDSMADRRGEKNGYNIPEMVACPDISQWLSDENICRELHEKYQSDRHLPEHAKRLLCDAYICMYQSSDVMMYR